ncbi:MAG TPA: ABC transporter permease [Puia sp.]|nr:ABC transporter permease [Puia sp.]
MLKNYLKIAWRNLLKDKAHSSINVAGMAVGLAVVMLIGLWIRDELSFDTYNSNYKAIAQIARKEITKGEIYVSNGNNHFPIPLAGELRTSYSHFLKHVALATEREQHIIAYNGNQFTEHGMYVENEFTDIFTLKMVAGTTAGFSDANTILLSRSAAQALFGKGDAIGKVVKLDNAQPLKVNGVFEDLPRNTTLSEVSFLCPFGLLVNSNPSVKDILNNWGNSSFFIYTEAAPGVEDKEIVSAIKDVYWEKAKGSQPQAPGNKVELFTYSMRDWHLRSEWKNGVQSGGQIQIVWLFGLIGLFVLLLACINFMNLSTARSEKRAKEVGVRKTMGSLRSQLVKQFLTEALLVVFVSFMVGVWLVLASLGWFNEIASKNITFPFLSTWFWGFCVAFMLVTTVVAGSYPAFYLSSFRPVKVLKGTVKAGRLAAISRKMLLSIQLVVSITLITGTIVVYRQIQLAKDRPIGYDRSGLIRITMHTPDLNGKYDVLKKELLTSGGAIGFAQSTSAATENNYFDDRFEWKEKDLRLHRQSFALTAVTYDYGKTVGWQFVAGRDFAREFSTDSSGVILNEAAVHYMSLLHPVGETIRWNGKLFTIVGVIKDMVKGSPYQPDKQSLFFLFPGAGPEITIRLNPQLSTATALGRIEPIFKRLDPSSPFEYTFVDDEYAQKFSSEQRIGALSRIFTTLAIFISCLGIFGLASFMAEQRIKEIGIRKVLGASVFSIWRLLSRDFVALVVISLVVATPLAYYLLHSWLQDYQIRTHLSGWIFFASGMSVLLITLATVSFQSVRAAISNPVNSLRSQ